MIDVRLMRLVDQSVGTALCSALAGWKRATSVFRRGSGEVRTIAVMKFFGLGSIIVASPSLRALHEAYPNAKLIFVTFKQNREILEILGLVDHAVYIDNSSMGAMLRTTLAAIAELRRQRVDLAIDFEFFAKYPLALSSVAGIPRKAGFYLTLEPWRRSLLDVHGYYNHYFHTRDIFLSLVYLLVTGDRYYLDFDKWRARYQYPRLEPADVDVRRVQELLAKKGMRSGQRLVLINPNAAAELAREIRCWPEERYAELAQTICREYPDAFVAFVGAKSERDYTSRIAASCNSERIVSVAGEMSLRELLAVLSSAQLFVSNDSGPMHLACLVGTPTVGLFFAETPTLFAPIGEHVATVAPNLYSLPMFSVYNGKNPVNLDNAPARAVPIDEAMTAVRKLIGVRAKTAKPRAAKG